MIHTADAPLDTLPNLNIDQGNLHVDAPWSFPQYDKIVPHPASETDPSWGNDCALAKDAEEVEYGPDIPAWYNNMNSVQDWFDDRGRHHLIHNTNRAFADRGIHYSYHKSHPSEKGWNLPREHKRHFLNLPREIRDQILDQILVVSATVTPKVVVCSWKRELQLPGYVVDGPEDGMIVKSIRIPHRNHTEIRRVLTKPIDATCLRVNKQLNDEGSKLLYGHNHFNCSMVPSCVLGYGRVCTMSQRGFPMVHRANMPSAYRIGNDTFMKAVKTLWKNHQNPDTLPGFIYCDPFLRFLYTIGPKNAANLRSVILQGLFRERHYSTPLKCDRNCRGVCLRYCLCLYGPFVAKHCKLQNLELNGPVLANFDWGCDDWLAGVSELEEPDESEESEKATVTKRQMYEKNLPLILKSEIWRFADLRDIKVRYIVDSSGSIPVPTLEEMRREIRTSGVAGHRPVKEEIPRRRRHPAL